MKPLLVLAAAFGLSVSAAQACPFQKTAQKDVMTVASIEQAPMSTVDDTTVTGSVTVEITTPAETAE